MNLHAYKHTHFHTHMNSMEKVPSSMPPLTLFSGSRRLSPAPLFAYLRGRCRRKRLRQPGRRRPAAAGEKFKQSFALSLGVSSLHGLDVRLLPIVLTLAKFFRTKFGLKRRFFKTKNGQKITKTKGSDEKRFPLDVSRWFSICCAIKTKTENLTCNAARLEHTKRQKA